MSDIDTTDEVEQPQSTAERRHPAEVTADRLDDHRSRYADRLTPREAEALGVVWRALTAIAEGHR